MSRLSDFVHRSRLRLSSTLPGKAVIRAKSRLLGHLYPMADAARRTKLRFRRLFWNEVDPVVRGVVLCLLGLGAFLSIVGWALDVAGLWSDLPFSVNMASSAAAACFGVPIALVLLQYLLGQQEEHLGRIRLRRLVQVETSKMADFAWQQVGDLGTIRGCREDFGVIRPRLGGPPRKGKGPRSR